jgi:hypothetical protein
MHRLMLPAILVAATLRAAGPPVPARDKYLLLDDRVIERVENAGLRVGTVTKHPRNPLFKEDRPWEVRFDNLYANVIFDEHESLYRCWYSPFIVDPAVTGTPAAQRSTAPYKPHDREMGICLATSRDGLAWDKPALGLVNFNGSTANNLVLRGPHGAGIFRDMHEGDAARRFKLFARASDSVRQMAVAFSPDGLHWSDLALCPEIKVPGDTHNNAFWSPELGKYVGITRMKTDQRLVARTESEDFIHWTRATEVLRGDTTNQTYAMPVFRHAGVYLGLPAVFNTRTDRTHCELAWSPDTITWHRIQPGTPLIPLGRDRGDYDWGCAYPAATPVFLENEIRLYYGASNGPHTSWRDGFLALATLHPDGFAGYAPLDESKAALIITRPLATRGGRLKILGDGKDNASIRASLTDPAGHKIAGRAENPANAADGIALIIDLPETSQQVQVRLEFQNAVLYSLTFVP